MTETQAIGYSFESTQWELSTEYQHDSLDGFQKALRRCALDRSSLSIGRVKPDELCSKKLHCVCS